MLIWRKLKIVTICIHVRRVFAAFSGDMKSGCVIADYFANVTKEDGRSNMRPSEICQHRYPFQSQPVFNIDRLMMAFCRNQNNHLQIMNVAWASPMRRFSY
jgi:hypothetical protein